CNWIKASRSFLRYVLWEPASWPRRILMYMADVIDSDEHYFSTVACQAGRFNRTLVNSSLHFAKFAKGSPHSLEMNDSYYDAFTNAAGVFLFARKFPRDSPTLDRIDRELLHRQPDRIAPGAWCSLPPSNTATLSDFSSLDASDASTSSTTSSSTSSSGSGSSGGVIGWLQRLLSPAPCNPRRQNSIIPPPSITRTVIPPGAGGVTIDNANNGGDNNGVGAGCPSTVDTVLVASLRQAPSERVKAMLPRFLELLDTSSSCGVPEGDRRMAMEEEWKDGDVPNIEKYQI
ncbi:hypothetical protein CLOP_g8420, partial [Closterium sp. NIES-67]